MTIKQHAQYLGFSDNEIKQKLSMRNIIPSDYANEDLKNLFEVMYRIEKKHTFVIIPSKLNATNSS